ncbi:histidine kinase dimerization and phosphoacceptor region [Ktedonobacter racemifer DSM 44963]|uniref:Histidine kinase dimerization and phosphoacceptor region n=2 Tax=Ktedonobacter racemifer TaxID=363277 RepID=D6U7Y2_KTERA|nr:histidine kinase dimerization and phosphoacceptor region [Ktedonobacter racemifer DSM 44963]
MRARDENSWRAKKNTCQGGVETSDEVMRESGVTIPLWRLYQHFWLLVCLFFPLASLVRKPDAWLRLAVGSTALLFFAISYTWIMWPHPASQGARTRGLSRLSVLLLVALCLQVTMFSLLDDPAWLWPFLGVSAMVGVVLPMRRAGMVVVLLTLLPLLITIFIHRGVAGIDWWWLIALMLLVRGLGLDMIGVSRMGSAIRELHTARQALARLKVEEERQRLARDLHDLLGQTLSVITLKSELARGLITEDPARCAQELAEIEQVGRTTLREVRKTVAGYRQPRLASELDGARQLLEAAGIESSIEELAGELPQPLDAVLAWTVREGVTNVIRHSRARHCLLRFERDQGEIGVEMLNDRSGTEDAEMQCIGQRSGLLGLRERVSGLGGTMEAGPLLLGGEPHFRLRVELPMQPQVEVTAMPEERS